MKRFAALYAALDQTTKTSEKVAALAAYFRAASAEDAAWAVYFLCGRKIRQLVPTKLLREWSAEGAGIEGWLFDECYEVVGDLAETMTLILPPPSENKDMPLHLWMAKRLLPLQTGDVAMKREVVEQAWRELDEQSRFVFHKIITGAFRVGVSRGLVVRGLAEASGIDANVLSHRLMGDWEPTGELFSQWINPSTHDAEISKPYPFFLAHPLESDPVELGDPHDWQAEWKWDGIRAQLIRRTGEVFIWSRGEDLTTDRFPELVSLAKQLPDGVVIDGEIVGYHDGEIMPFAALQRRIGRKQLGKKILSDVPVTLIAFDLLELNGVDIRQQPLSERRAQLEQVILDSRLRGNDDGVAGNDESNSFLTSTAHHFSSWEELAALRQTSREEHAEGLMLKRLNSPYRVGRPRGDWWKWKIEPYTVDAVLIYAQRGSGKRASLYTDYTFAVWDNGQLVPFAKAYSGLTDAEIARVDRFVRRNTVERFGPVRSVTPELVFELAFENISESNRHKSGVAVRFPRIARWREDLRIEDADSLDTIKAMIRAMPLATGEA
jgi:DNA ligase 1